jgi:hypothetical protein
MDLVSTLNQDMYILTKTWKKVFSYMIYLITGIAPFAKRAYVSKQRETYKNGDYYIHMISLNKGGGSWPRNERKKIQPND